jgi:hypothetical protein
MHLTAERQGLALLLQRLTRQMFVMLERVLELALLQLVQR